MVSQRTRSGSRKSRQGEYMPSSPIYIGFPPQVQNTVEAVKQSDSFRDITQGVVDTLYFIYLVVILIGLYYVITSLLGFKNWLTSWVDSLPFINNRSGTSGGAGSGGGGNGGGGSGGSNGGGGDGGGSGSGSSSDGSSVDTIGIVLFLVSGTAFLLVVRYFMITYFPMATANTTEFFKNKIANRTREMFSFILGKTEQGKMLSVVREVQSIGEETRREVTQSRTLEDEQSYQAAELQRTQKLAEDALIHLQELRKQVSEQEEQIAQKEQQVRDLSQRLGSQQDKEDADEAAKENLRLELQSAKEELDATLERKVELGSDLNDAENSLLNAQRQRDQARKEVLRLSEELTKLKERAEKAESDLESTRALAEENDAIASVTGELLDKSEKENKKVLKKAKALEKENKALASAAEKAQSAFEKLSEELEGVKGELKDTKQQLERTEGALVETIREAHETIVRIAEKKRKSSDSGETEEGLGMAMERLVDEGSGRRAIPTKSDGTKRRQSAPKGGIKRRSDRLAEDLREDLSREISEVESDVESVVSSASTKRRRAAVTQAGDAAAQRAQRMRAAVSRSVVSMGGALPPISEGSEEGAMVVKT